MGVPSVIPDEGRPEVFVGRGDVPADALKLLLDGEAEGSWFDIGER
jgi:hypothetical protein